MNPADRPEEFIEMYVTAEEKLIIDTYRNDPRLHRLLDAFVISAKPETTGEE